MKTVKINLANNETNLFAAIFEISDDAKVNNVKLSQSITKATFRRYEAQLSGIKTNIKASKPFSFKVIIDNKEAINTDVLALQTGMDSKLKISTHTYKKDPNRAKALFQETILYIIDAASEFNEDVKNAFE